MKHDAPSLRFGYSAAAQAGSADTHALAATLHLGADRPQVDVPAAAGDVVRVADVVARLRLLAADFTNLCHESLQNFRQGGWLKLNYTDTKG